MQALPNRYEFEMKSSCGVCQKQYDRCHCRPQFASPYIENYKRVCLYREERVSGKMILAAKDRNNRLLYGFLADEMAKSVQTLAQKADVIVYIPCAEQTYRKKGFDHGKELAKALGERLELPVKDCFVRKKGKEQKNLGAKERLDNSKESLFPKKAGKAQIEGKRVLLVDDVMTTGASALVASVHLQELGAEAIDFVSFGSR